VKIIIMGTGPFAVPTAERLWNDGHQIPLVVVRPIADPSAKKQPPTPVRDWAKSKNLPLFDPASINDSKAVEHLAAIRADLFFVCDYGQILSRACLGASFLGGINLHGSLLPRHRGAAPVQWALLRGDQQAGVSVIHMTPKLDGGPILSVAQTEVLADENAGQLEPRLAFLGVEATVEAIDKLSGWDGASPIGSIQSQEAVTKAPRFDKSHGQMDFRLSAEYLVRLVRALQPWPGTFAELKINETTSPMRILIRSARACSHQSGRSPGQAWMCNSSDLGLNWPAPWHRLIAIATQSGTLLVSRLQPSGKREMVAEEFLRGHSLGAHSKFVLPERPLDELK
jgi:methionyl-tRNA formyltransferase